jgi:hypothetical protein
LFHRISNLITVRSDVFSAYILVRIGINGAQRRVLAILDRSKVDSDKDKVKIIALYRVPESRKISILMTLTPLLYMLTGIDQLVLFF